MLCDILSVWLLWYFSRILFFLPKARSVTSKSSRIMGSFITIIDCILFIYFFIMAIFAPTLDGQACLPQQIYPQFLVDLVDWYSREYGDYLVVEKPHFFVGLVWIEVLFQWPISLINLYAIAAKKTWFNTTCLIYGVSVFTSMVAILAEMVGSGKASDKLLMIYYPFLGVAVLAIIRGLISPPSKTTSPSTKKVVPGRKKRV